MKYYLEYLIKNKIWRIYDVRQPEGYPANCLLELTPELFDNLMDELLEKCKEKYEQSSPK